MKDKTLLMIPGPTPVPETVLLDMAKSPVPKVTGQCYKLVYGQTVTLIPLREFFIHCKTYL